MRPATSGRRGLARLHGERRLGCQPLRPVKWIRWGLGTIVYKSPRIASARSRSGTGPDSPAWRSTRSMVHDSTGSRSDFSRTRRIPIPRSLPIRASVSDHCFAEEPRQAQASRRDLCTRRISSGDRAVALSDAGTFAAPRRTIRGDIANARGSASWIERSPSNHSRRCGNNRLSVSASREFSCNCEAIANREHAQFDSRVVADFGIEDPKRLGVLGTVALVGDGPAPEYVVEQRQTARTQ